jgi:hypothetical protein
MARRGILHHKADIRMLVNMYNITHKAGNDKNVTYGNIAGKAGNVSGRKLAAGNF